MKKIIIFTIIAIVVIVGGGLLYLSNADTTPISHHWDDYQTWHKSTGNEPITGDETKFLGGKHRGDEGYREIYVNKIGEAVNKGAKPYFYPEGTVVVKEQFKNKNQFERGKKPELTIMIKLAQGSSPETGDWGYVAGFRRKIHMGTSSRAEFCGGCHAGANLKKADYVFINETNHSLKNK